MVWIASGVPSVGAGSFQFTSIPQTFTHLQMRYFVRGSDAGAVSYMNIYINGSAYGTNYSGHTIGGDGANAYSTNTVSGGGIGNLFTPGSSSTANCFVSGIVDVLDYTNANKNKVIRVQHGYDTNGAGYAIFGSGMQLSTASVTSIGLFNMTFVANCRIDLYGITTSSVTGA
jgi:hypothetical protein